LAACGPRADIGLVEIPQCHSLLPYRGVLSFLVAGGITDLIRIGRTSITVHVEAWVIRRSETNRVLVTDGNFTYVALDNERRPRTIKR
jgi:hypothetical protein